MLNREQIERSVDWLLGNGSAPVKYLAYVHLLKAAPHSKEMRELWTAAKNDPDSLELFSKQRENGETM